MKKFLTLILATSVVCGVTSQASAYENHHWSKWAKLNCRMGPYGNDSHVRDLIRCAAIRVDDRKDIRAALAIAARESGFEPHAANPYSTAAGLFQWLSSSWPGSRFPALRRQFDYPNTRWHARAAAFVSLTVMKRYGCGAWRYSGTVLC